MTDFNNMTPIEKFKYKIGKKVWIHVSGISLPVEVTVLDIIKDSDIYSTDYYFKVLNELNVELLTNIIFVTKEYCQKYINVITYDKLGMIEI